MDRDNERKEDVDEDVKEIVKDVNVAEDKRNISFSNKKETTAVRPTAHAAAIDETEDDLLLKVVAARASGTAANLELDWGRLDSGDQQPDKGAAPETVARSPQRKMGVGVPVGTPPNLTGQGNPDIAQPGAYAVAPNPNPTSIPNMLPQDPPPDIAIQSDTIPVQISHEYEGLVQADLAVPGEDLERAQPMDPDVITRRKQRQPQLLFILVLIALVCIGVAVVLGVVLGNKTGESLPQALAPTTPPSTAPTAAPSLAPTSVLDDLYFALPNYTQASLEDPFSPQSQAYAWLLSHQEITNLPEWKKMQLFALATFFYSMEGDHWPSVVASHWLDDTRDECDWFSNNYGSFGEDGTYEDGNTIFQETEACDNTTGAFIDLALGSLNLSMASQPLIPPEISLLTSLKYLHVYDSDIHGALADFIPSQLFQMTWLEELGLNGNLLTGSIVPENWAALTSLLYLDFSSNLFIGQIPSELAQMNALETLYLAENEITGTIPKELSNITMLRYIALYNTEVTGQVPSEVGLLINLEYFDVEGCSLTGNVPTELGLLENMQILWLNGNDFTGRIPTELGQLSLLTQM